MALVHQQQSGDVCVQGGRWNAALALQHAFFEYVIGDNAVQLQHHDVEHVAIFADDALGGIAQMIH